jgi:hypothetical protein
MMATPPPARPPKKGISLWRKLAFALFGGIVGFGAMQLLQSLLPKVLWNPGARIALLLVGMVSIPVAWWVAVAFHEAGHLLGAWLRGGRFLLYQVGPLRLQRTPAGLALLRNRGINVMGGLAASILPDKGDLPARFRVLLAGGPLASFALAVTAFASLIQTSEPDVRVPWWDASLRIFVVLTGLYSAIAFVITALPFEQGGFRTDGQRFLILLKSGPEARQEAAMLSLGVAANTGVRPRDYPPHTVADALQLGDGSMTDLYARWFAYFAAADRKEWDKAREFLDQMMAGEPKLARFVADLVRAEYAWLLAEQGSDPATARAWLESAGPVEMDPSSRLRAEAAVLLAEGNRSLATDRAKAALVALEKSSIAAVRNEWAVENLQSLIARARTGSKPSTTP